MVWSKTEDYYHVRLLCTVYSVSCQPSVPEAYSVGSSLISPCPHLPSSSSAKSNGESGVTEMRCRLGGKLEPMAVHSAQGHALAPGAAVPPPANHRCLALLAAARACAAGRTHLGVPSTHGTLGPNPFRPQVRVALVDKPVPSGPPSLTLVPPLPPPQKNCNWKIVVEPLWSRRPRSSHRTPRLTGPGGNDCPRQHNFLAGA